MKSEDRISRRILWNFVRHPNLDTKWLKRKVLPRLSTSSAPLMFPDFEGCMVCGDAADLEPREWRLWSLKNGKACISSKVFFFYLFANCFYHFHLWERRFKKAEITVAAVTRGPRVCFIAASRSNTGDAMSRITWTKFRTRCIHQVLVKTLVWILKYVRLGFKAGHGHRMKVKKKKYFIVYHKQRSSELSDKFTRLWNS